MKKQFSLFFLFMCILCLGSIKSEAKAFTISAPANTVYTNQQMKLKVSPSAMKGKVRWKTSDKKVATVSSKGIVTGKKAGKATIYAISLENKKEKAAFRIKVKTFKGKSLSAKASIIQFDSPNNSTKFPDSGKEFRVFSSRKEIDEYAKLYNSFKEKYGIRDFAYTDLGKQLKQYKKSFFKKNSLCLMYVASGSSSMPVSAKNLELKQYQNGKVIGSLHIKIGKQKPDELWTDDVQEYYALIELKKADTDMIQAYKVKKDK